MSDSTPVPPSGEQTFFDHPATDRTMGVVMALAAEVWVLKDRLHNLEQLLSQSGHLNSKAVEHFQPTADQAATLAAERDAFVESLMINLLGQQQSKGIHQGHQAGTR